jgi:hypothetical protein
MDEAICHKPPQETVPVGVAQRRSGPTARASECGAQLDLRQSMRRRDIGQQPQQRAAIGSV